jgi:hypothetical protein
MLGENESLEWNAAQGVVSAQPCDHLRPLCLVGGQFSLVTEFQS